MTHLCLIFDYTNKEMSPRVITTSRMSDAYKKKLIFEDPIVTNKLHIQILYSNILRFVLQHINECK